LDGQGWNKQEVGEFHSVVIWDKLAQTASAYLEKGALVLVEGRLATRTWTDKAGAPRKATEIIAEDIQFGPRASGSPAAQPKAPGPAKRSNTEQRPLLDGDETDTGRSFEKAFGEEEEIKPEDIPF
jgi:single-strand DNA-binding protein